MKATMSDINEHQAVLIEVTTAGKYYFSVDQDDSRLYDGNFTNADVRLTVAKIEPTGFKWVSCAYSNRRNTAAKCKINPGKYIAIFEMSSEPEGVRNLTFSSYGSNIAGLQTLTLSQSELKIIEYLSWRDWAVNDKGKWMKKKETEHIQDGNLFVDVEKQKTNRTKDYGVSITKYTLLKANCDVQCGLETITGNDEEGEEEGEEEQQNTKSNYQVMKEYNGEEGVVMLGKFKCEIDLEKEKSGSSGYLQFYLSKTGSTPTEIPEWTTLNQRLQSTPVSVPTCKVPPQSNPHLTKSSLLPGQGARVGGGFGGYPPQ